MAPVLGGIEAGGTRWRCAVGTGPGDLSAEATIATTTPAETLAAAVFEREGRWMPSASARSVPST